MEPSLLYLDLLCASLNKVRPKVIISSLRGGVTGKLCLPGEEETGVRRSTNSSHEQKRAPPSRDANSKGVQGSITCALGEGSASLVAQRLKCLPAMWETWAQSLGWKDPLEQEMATHSSILAWRIPWTEEPDRLQSTGLQRVGHD